MMSRSMRLQRSLSAVGDSSVSTSFAGLVEAYRAVAARIGRRAVVPPAKPVHRKRGRFDAAVKPFVELQMRL